MKILKKIQLTSLFKKNNLRKKLFIFFLITFIFRLWYGFYSNSFGQDGARDLILIENKINNKEFITGYGPKASVGDFYLPPAYYQIDIFLSFLTLNNPFTMKIFVILLESLTPVILILIFKELAKKTFDENSSYPWLIAGAYAFSPIPTIFGTFAWNPNTIPFLSTLALLSWLRIINSINLKLKSANWEIIIGILSVTIAIHFHYQAVVIAPFAFIIFLWSFIKQKDSRKYWLLGILLAILTFVPYFWAEINNNWKNTIAISEYFSNEHSKYFDRVSKPAYVLTFIPAFIERVLAGKNITFLILGRIIFFIGGITLFLKSIKTLKQQPINLWLGFYFISLLIMFRVYKGDKLDYYLSTLYIFPTILNFYLINKYKKLFFIVLLFFVFQAGLFFGTQEKVNGYKELKNIISFIEKETNTEKVRFIFYNDDDINTFYYGVKKFSELENDKNSLVLVEVCDKKDSCIWNNDFSCRDNRAHTYSGLIKSSGTYNQKSILTLSNGKIILIGNLEKIPEKQNYQIFKNNLDYGNDFIDLSFYEK